MRLFLLTFFALLLCPLGARAAGTITKESLDSEGKKRAYYLYVPKKVAESKSPAPLVLTLHGSGSNGKILVELWQEYADKEGIILAGPDATEKVRWNIPRDGPDFLRDVVEDVKSKQPVNARRVYLFGHSAGAVFAIYMATLEPEYYAAAFVHAGAVREDSEEMLDTATRKISIALFVGTQDAYFPLTNVRATRDALVKRGFDVSLTEIKGHNHNYYGRSKEINKAAWEFLKDKTLTEEPKYTQHNFK
ncbi:MAG: dienelactone hydrolase family protein [Rubrivivax sp.]|nr:dienelactone hydrolase family protein [Pyrinomonadaceae bacterium]